jgi:altronate dehydratase large subunit
MDTPGFDIESMSGMAAAGAQMIIFTTGRGSAAGFPGVPVIKVASNSGMFNRMVGDMDVNAGSIIDGSKTLDEVGKEIFELAVDVAGSRRTCAEINRSVPFSILKQGPSF